MWGWWAEVGLARLGAPDSNEPHPNAVITNSGSTKPRARARHGHRALLAG